MNFLNQEISLQFNSAVFFIVLGIILLLLITVGVLFYRLKKVQSVSKPKYGFLGKSLYGLVVLLLLVGALTIGVISTTTDKGVFKVNANKTVASEIITSPLLKENGYTFVDFKVVPTVGGVIWGSNTDKFDVYWSFVGSDGQNSTYLEQAVSSKNLSGLQKYFKDDTYKVTVVIVYDTSSYTFTKNVSF